MVFVWVVCCFASTNDCLEALEARLAEVEGQQAAWQQEGMDVTLIRSWSLKPSSAN